MHLHPARFARSLASLRRSVEACSCCLSIELCKSHYQRSGGLCELMQSHTDFRDGTVSVFRSGLMDELQIVDEHYFGLHPDGLRSNPSNTLTSGRADEQRIFLNGCQPVKLVNADSLVFDRVQRYA